MKDAARFVVFVCIVFAAAWGIDIIRDRSMSLTVFEPAPLYAISPSEYPKNNPLMRTLRPGEKVKVLRSAGGKDFVAYRIETEAGEIGWVILGDGVRETDPVSRRYL